MIEVDPRTGRASVKPRFRPFYRIGKQGVGQATLDYVGRRDLLMQNDGQGKFTDVTRSAGITAQGHGLSATWFDYDGDGDADLHVANDLTDPDYFFRNNGDGTFTDIIQQIAPYTTWYSMGADAADLNNDGLLDLFVADMSGTTHFKRKTSMGAMSDSQTFLATANPPQYMRNVVYLNSGAERFLEAAYLAGLANSDWTWGVKAQDFDNDGRVDLLITNGVSKNFNDSDNPGARSCVWARPNGNATCGPARRR